MLIEFPAFCPDKTKIDRPRCYVNPEKVTGIMLAQMGGQQMGAKGVPFPIVLGEAWQIMLEGGGQVLVSKDADLNKLIEWGKWIPATLTAYSPAKIFEPIGSMGDRPHVEDHSADHKLAVLG